MILTTRRRITWAIVASVGFGAGATVSGLVVAAVARPLSPWAGGAVYIAVYGGVIGGIAGLVQLAVIPRGRTRWHVWLGASIAGFAVGYVLAAVVGEALANAIDPGVNLIVGEGTIEVSAGAVLGLAIGLAQRRVLRSVLPGMRWWLLATAVGVGLGYGSAAAVLELFEVAVLKANLVPAFGAIVGLFVGAAQAMALGTGRAAGAPTQPHLDQDNRATA